MGMRVSNTTTLPLFRNTLKQLCCAKKVLMACRPALRTTSCSFAKVKPGPLGKLSAPNNGAGGSDGSMSIISFVMLFVMWWVVDVWLDGMKNVRGNNSVKTNSKSGLLLRELFSGCFRCGSLVDGRLLVVPARLLSGSVVDGRMSTSKMVSSPRRRNTP